MSLILWCLAVALFAYIGYFLADTSYNVWEKGDSTSWAARVFFPFCAYNGKVGNDNALTFICFVKVGIEKSSGWYFVWVGAFWPIKVCWTIPGILLFTLPKFIAFVWQKARQSWAKSKPAAVSNLYSEAGDTLETLYRKLHVIDAEVAQLKADRATVVAAIEEWKRTLESVCEAEETTSMGK